MTLLLYRLSFAFLGTTSRAATAVIPNILGSTILVGSMDSRTSIHSCSPAVETIYPSQDTTSPLTVA